MKCHPKHHQHATDGHHPGATAITQCDREGSADKRCKRENRTSPGRTEGPLCEQIKAKAQAITACSDNEENQRCAHRRKRLAKQKREHGCRCGPNRRFAQHDLAGIAFSERARQRIVRTPCGRCNEHGEHPPQLRPATAALVKNQRNASGKQQEHGNPHASVHGLLVEQACQNGGEQRFKREHQGRTGAAGVLQTPSQRHWANHCAESRHRKQARQIATHQPCFMFHALAREQTDHSRSGIKQCSGSERAQACTEMLDQWRADAEQSSGQQGQKAAADGWKRQTSGGHELTI